MSGQIILVVDDEKAIVEVIRAYLENAGYEVVSCYNGKDALISFEQSAPNLVILDLMLPDLSGEEICLYIRKKSRVPIIMLTARVQEDDLINGLQIGADDYVTKPFSPRQLMARVQAVLRRVSEEAFPLTNQLSFNGGDLVIDSHIKNIRQKIENDTRNPQYILTEHGVGYKFGGDS